MLGDSLMRILFVRPNRDAFGCKPVGIALLSGILKSLGHTVNLFDTTRFELGYVPRSSVGECINIHKPINSSDLMRCGQVKGGSIDTCKIDFLQKLEEFDPDLIAFSVLSDEKLVAYELAKTAKTWDPKVPIVFGNKHPTVSPEETISNEFVDYICVGEGLDSFPELLGRIESGKNPSNVKGIWSKKKNAIARNKVGPLRVDLDCLPYLDWDIFEEAQFYKPYTGKLYRGGDYMSNWGCVYHCAYCINDYFHNLYGTRSIRRYSPDRAVKELKYLKEKYRLEFIKFYDEDFLLRRRDVLEEFACLYKNEVGLPFVMEANPKSINQWNVELLRDMGCVSASVGVESGNESLRRDILGRSDSVQEVIQAFNLLNNVGIRTVAFVMLGLPFDSREAIFDTINLLRKAKVDTPAVGFFYPYPGTRSREICISNGFFDPNKENSDTALSGTRSALTLSNISQEELVGIWQTFVFYCKFPKSFWPFIQRAEVNDTVGKEIYSLLGKIYKEYVQNSNGEFCDSAYDVQ